MFTLKYNSYLPYKQSSEILVRQQFLTARATRGPTSYIFVVCHFCHVVCTFSQTKKGHTTKLILEWDEWWWILMNKMNEIYLDEWNELWWMEWILMNEIYLDEWNEWWWMEWILMNEMNDVESWWIKWMKYILMNEMNNDKSW